MSTSNLDRDVLSYVITAGNDDGTFAIETSTAAFAAAGALGYKSTWSYTLTAEARDDEGLTATASASITVTEVNELLGAPLSLQATSSIEGVTLR